MEQDRLHELAAGYALDALDDGERAAFEQHLAECEQCTTQVHAFRETAALLAHAEEDPSRRRRSVSACSRRLGASGLARASSYCVHAGRCG